MKKTDLKSNYSMFGGKGDVWSNTAHISKDGSPRTLCGKPMLSTNWVRIEDVQTVGCTKCIELYKEENK